MGTRKDCPEPTNGNKFISYKDFMEFVTQLGIISKDVERLSKNAAAMLDSMNRIETETLRDLVVRMTEISDKVDGLQRSVESLDNRIVSLETSHGGLKKAEAEFDMKIETLSRTVKFMKWLVGGVLAVVVGWAITHSYFLIKLAQSLR